jgi:hypothetical protein
MNVGGGEDDFMDKILQEAHLEEIQFGFPCNVIPPVLHSPPGTVDDVVVCPSRAQCWSSIFIPHAHWVGRGRCSILREGLVVVVHLYSLRTKLFDFLMKSCAAEYIWHNIINRGMVCINHRGGDRIHCGHLACKDSLRVDIDLEIFLYNVKNNPFTKLRNGDKVAHLLPLANLSLSLPSDHSTSDAAPFFG